MKLLRCLPFTAFILTVAAQGQTYNVRDFGAAGNGSADDTVAIRQAIAAAAGYASANGQVATIYFPAGTYAVAPQASDTEWQTSSFPFIFEIPASNLRFLGDGPEASVISCYMIDLADPNASWKVIGDGAGYFKIKRGGAFRYPFDRQIANIVFEGLRITGNTPATPNYAVGGASTRLGASGGVLRNYTGTINLDAQAPHGYVDGTLLRFANNPNRPSEIIPQQAYYVVNATADAFQIATAPDGTPISFSDSVDAPDKRFIATNGDGWNMGHTALAMMNGINGTTLIINCMLDRWRGEIIHAAGDDSHLIVRNSVFEQCNASSISVPSAVVEDSVFRSVLNGFENYARQSHHRLEVRRCQFIGLSEGGSGARHGVVYLGFPEASCLIEDSTFQQLECGVYLAETASNVIIRRNNFTDGSPVRVSRLGLYPNDPAAFDNITIEENDFRITKGNSGSVVIYTQFGNISNRNFVIKNNRIHAGTVSGSWRYLLYDICGASAENRQGFRISGNALDCIEDANATNSVRAIWSGNTRGVHWRAGSLNDWYWEGEGQAPLAINQWSSDLYEANNWTSRECIDITLAPSLKTGKFPVGYAITLSTIATNSWQLVVDPEWNNFTAPVLVTKGNPVTIVVQENGKFGLMPPPAAEPAATEPEPAGEPQPVGAAAPEAAPPPVFRSARPVAPILAVDWVGMGAVSLKWVLNDTVDSFVVHYGRPGGMYLPLEGGELDAMARGLDVTGLELGGTYKFRIRACRNGYWSDWSPGVSVQIPYFFEEAAAVPVVEAVHFWTFDDGLVGTATDTGLAPLPLDTAQFAKGEGIGRFNQGLAFSGRHGGVQVPDDPSLNTGAQSELTISFWVKVDATTAGLRSVLFEQGGYWRGLNLLLVDGRLEANGWNRPPEESGWAGTTLHGGTLPVDQWNHIALVLKAGPQIEPDGLMLYLNGGMVDSGPASGLWPQNDDNGIGQVRGSTVFMGRQVRRLDPFRGRMDDISIWNTALSLGELQQLSIISYN